MKCGLLPLCQESGVLGEISYHDYEGILVDDAERDRIIRSLGPNNKVMVLRNHGVVACGSSIEEAFHYAFNLVAACETQVKFTFSNHVKLRESFSHQIFHVFC
jgi:adducin